MVRHQKLVVAAGLVAVDGRVPLVVKAGRDVDRSHARLELVGGVGRTK